MLRSIFAAAWVVLGFGLAPVATAGEKRPLELDDLYRQEQVSDFTVSPRGDEAVYVRSWYDVRFPGRRTSLWRVDGATGRHEPLEPGEPDGRMPTYSPDGRRLAFISADGVRRDSAAARIPRYSDPSGAVQVLDRSEAGTTRRNVSLPELQPSADPFYGRLRFAASGAMLFYSAGYATAGRRVVADPFVSGDDDQGEGYEGYAPTKIVLCGGNKGNTNDAFAYRDVFALGAGDRFWYGDPQQTPDGAAFICHANRTDDQESVRYSINKNYDLWRFELDGTKEPDEIRPQRLTVNPGPDVSPRVSPDGKHVLYLSVPRNGPHNDVFNLCVLSLSDKESQPRMLVNAHDAERAADGTPPFQPTFPLRDDSWIDDEHVRVRGVRGMKAETRVFDLRRPNEPLEDRSQAEPPPSQNERLRPPRVNTWLDERFAAREEVVRWQSFDGLEIEGVLTLPPAELKEFQAPYPVIVYPHGGPHSASKPGFNFAVHLFAARGYAVFQPNFRGTYGYGRKFLDAARFDMGGADMQDVLTGLDRLIEQGTVDRRRQFVYGISYGGYAACRLTTLSDRFRAACAQNAVTDLYAMWSLGDLQSWTEWEFGGRPWETIEHEGRKIDVGALMRDRSPTTHAHRVKTPTLMLHADHDRRCPVAMGRMYHRALKESGCETELVVYADERHGLWQVRHQADVLRRVLAWFAAHDEAASVDGTRLK